MFCSVVTKNSNWKILTKNLVTFKRWDGVKYEKLKYFWGSRKNPIFKGHKKTIYKGIAKEGGLGQFADLRGGGGLTRKKGVVFWRGVDTAMHTMHALEVVENWLFRLRSLHKM